MKRILFLVLVLQSFLFAFNSSVCVSGSVLSPNSTYVRDTKKIVTFSNLDPTSNTKYSTSAGHFEFIQGLCGSSSNDVSYFEVGNDDAYMYVLYGGLHVVIRAGIVSTGTCPIGQIPNPDTNICECPPPPPNYNDAITSLTTPESCTVANASGIVQDGDTHFISGVLWDSCRNKCLATYSECPCNQAILNGVCTPVSIPDGCPSNASYSNQWAICVGDSCKYASGCSITYIDPSTNTICSNGVIPAGCCTTGTGSGGGSTTPPDDSNTTNPDDGSGDTTDGGDDGSSSGDSNTTTGGTTGGTTGSGDSNTSSTLVDGSLLGEGDFNSALDDAKDMVDDIKNQFTTFKDNVENHFSDIEEKYNSTKVMFMNGTPPIMSGGGSLDCASFNFHGKHITLDLSKAVIIQPLVYYIFTAFFMFLNFVFLVNHLFKGLD